MVNVRDVVNPLRENACAMAKYFRDDENSEGISPGRTVLEIGVCLIRQWSSNFGTVLAKFWGSLRFFRVW